MRQEQLSVNLFIRPVAVRMLNHSPEFYMWAWNELLHSKQWSNTHTHTPSHASLYTWGYKSVIPLQIWCQRQAVYERNRRVK